LDPRPGEFDVFGSALTAHCPGSADGLDGEG
jgi:hypothetical protein